MQVEKLDHINIIVDSLDETSEFYASLFDLEPTDGPPHMKPEQARWMLDGHGNAILHLNTADFPRHFDRTVARGSDTGAVHHVALRCKDFDEMIRRLNARGADYEINDLSHVGLRQIFTHDPNNVLLELNIFDASRAA